MIDEVRIKLKLNCKILQKSKRIMGERVIWLKQKGNRCVVSWRTTLNLLVGQFELQGFGQRFHSKIADTKIAFQDAQLKFLTVNHIIENKYEVNIKRQIIFVVQENSMINTK